jgi:hypothetical protein
LVSLISVLKAIGKEIQYKIYSPLTLVLQFLENIVEMEMETTTEKSTKWTAVAHSGWLPKFTAQSIPMS